MGQALYRNYRPKSLADVVGQKHVTDTISKALKSGRISHAYLFTGPRGVGKTSVARILAHEVNQLPYDDESIHLDIIEIDAASNRRIDEVRDLRDKVHIAPTSSKYKVYIIDEVHMLTREAFNALLKTLEEPPAHCIFILATTEAHKLPETIVSRTQRFSFKPIDKGSAVEHLKVIAKQEKLNITNEALELLAEHGEGSFRDSISLLDQLSGLGKTIDADTVRENLGIPKNSQIEALIETIAAGDTGQLINNLTVLRDQAISPSAIASGLSTVLRSKLLETSAEVWQVNLLRQLLEVPASHNDQETLEIALLEATIHNTSVSGQNPKRHFDQQSSVEKSELVNEVSKLPAQKINDKQVPSKQSNVENFSLDSWPLVLSQVKQKAASLYTALRLAEPKIENERLILAFQFPLHQKKVAQTQTKNLVSQIVEDITGANVSIDCIIDKSIQSIGKDDKPQFEAQPSEHMTAISNIFGGVELLES